MRGALVLTALVMGLGGCVSTPESETPAWADTSGFPSLREVPLGGTSANTDPAHWSAVEADLLAARQQLVSNPRSQNTGPTEDPQQFVEEARREVEATRNAHNPY